MGNIFFDFIILKGINKIGASWNISMFHYRNHGAAFGRVLMELQVPPKEKYQVKIFLKELGCHFIEDSNNPALRCFKNEFYSIGLNSCKVIIALYRILTASMT